MFSSILRIALLALALLAFGQGLRAPASRGPDPRLRVNQVGYLPNAPKIAFLADTEAPATFEIFELEQARSVLSGKFTGPVIDPDSADTVFTADFSSLKEPGEYRMVVRYKNATPSMSYDFSIRPDVYSDTLLLAARFFYGQRCGTDVDLGPRFPGYRYEACHRENEYHASSGKSGPANMPKGWHDAGDYGRYITNSGIATGTLLWAYEFFPQTFGKLSLDIPESGDATPDLLDEARWNLEWMLSMQDEDGGVWHKSTPEKFPDFVPAERDMSVNYVVGTGEAPYKSTCATADLAAVAAIAARLYQPFDAEFAKRNRSAAERAFEWAMEHPNVVFVQNPKGVATGEYGDKNCKDELLWAAGELSRTTGEEKYEAYFTKEAPGLLAQISATSTASWSNVAPLALWTYALRNTTSPLADSIRFQTLNTADEIVERSRKHAYRTSMTSGNYFWGSNSVVTNYGMHLLVANRFKSNRRYLETALENLHYLLGRNALSLSFMTQVGSNSVRNPHHRPSGSDNNSEPWPGMLAGGPNNVRQDPAMKRIPRDTPSALMYLDDQESYATNEVAINWNAPLVFLLAGVQQLP